MNKCYRQKGHVMSSFNEQCNRGFPESYLFIIIIDRAAYMAYEKELRQ